MEQSGTGPEKKACAIDIILAVYDEYDLDIPYLPNMFEKQMLKVIIDVAIDGIVAILNKHGVFAHE
jgi:ketopantoate reductase